MTQELLLLSWLVVLLRTREDTDTPAWFEWAHSSPGQENGARREPETVMRLSARDVVPALDSSVAQAVAAISRHIAVGESGLDRPGPISLILSTGPLSRLVDGAPRKTQPLLHLETRVDHDRAEICPVWQTDGMLPFTVTRHVETLADTIKLCVANPDAPVQSLLGPTTHDLDQIWGWNHTAPPTYDACMHDVISAMAQRLPDKTAVDSWDGSLTYGQIDSYSTLLARTLRADLGVALHDAVPVCFEKSRWTIVAVLAVMKAGATMVLMDPTLPLPRLQNMGQQVGAKTMVTSRMQHDLSNSILPDGKFVVVEQDTFTHLSDLHAATAAAREPLPAVPSSALMYIIFTSGSTGTPKGVKISHTSYTSSAYPRAKAVGYAEDSRVLDFASYAFDVSIDSMLLTLANGGCLCIPSDEDRLNDINGVMRNMRVNYAGITPSVARILDLDVIAALTGGLGLGGEAASARDVNHWGQYARIIIGYGPCECTIGCTVNSSAATGRDYISIGPGNGAAIWVADPNDHETLLPLGAVGELLVEGPIVGQGYLNDPDKTATVFIENPRWLTAGHGTYPGRSGRLYKSGDLGSYDPDGSGAILFAGRKDTQVKLRGQRVELGEIESQLKARMPQDTTVIAEVIVPHSLGAAKGQPTLVAFVAALSQSAKASEEDLEYSQDLHRQLREALARADAEVAEVLPRYMVPTAYIPVSRIPTLISGKTDRKKLREFGAKVDLRHLTARNSETTSSNAPGGSEDRPDRPLTDMEQHLRQAWALTLKVDADAIRLDDNFFALGGDSLAAMRLSSACREQGLDLSVINTFGHPTLAAMAAVVVDGGLRTTAAMPERPAFSLIPQPLVESSILEASQICETAPAKIQDIYPCTPTQESLFTFSLKSTEVYIAQRVARVPAHITLDAWTQAWESVVAATPILRSRLVQLRDHPGLGQVVIDEGIAWQHATTALAAYLEADRTTQMTLGQSLARYAIVHDDNDGARHMVWTIHHAVYDGWSEPLLLAQVHAALYNTNNNNTNTNTTTTTTPPTPPPATMADFVQHVTSADPAAAQAFWRTELAGAVGPQFPRVPSRDFVPTPSGRCERHMAVRVPTATPFPFTPATLVRGAWALVASQHAGSDDVVFGETLTGRDIALRGVEAVVGPLIATVPVRVRVDRRPGGPTVRAYLAAVQTGVLARTPFQHVGMQHIRRVSRDAQYACEAPTGLVIQPEMELGEVGEGLGFAMGDVLREALHFNPYPLMLAAGIQKGGVRVCASFDEGLVEARQMERILAQLETACCELARDLERTLDQVPVLSADELNQIWRWNREPPSLVLDGPSGRLRADAALVKPGSVYRPRATVPWVCDPRNPSLLSPIGSPGELWLEGPFGTVESPAWLVTGSAECAGRTGKVQPTGDIVRLREDGSLEFIGHRDGHVSSHGHSMDMAELEVHFAKYLPSVRATAVPVSQEGQEPVGVVFIEQPQTPEEDVRIEIISESHSITDDGVSTTICAATSVSLAAGLKRLDKFAQISLAPRLIPSAYIIVDKMPIAEEQVDRSRLQQLASKIPQHILDRLRDGLQEAWASSRLLAAQATTKLTAAEDLLRTAWARILGLAPEQIDVDDNFFRLGGDSVLAMKLVSLLRSQGHGLTVADIFRHMRLGDAAKVLKMDQFGASNGQTGAASRQPPYRPFSLLGSRDAEAFVTEIVRPQLGDARWSVQDVYPVTDSQALDVRDTVQPPRTSVQYTTLYFADIDQTKLARACDDLVQAHDILRTVFIEHDSTLFQVVLEDLTVPVTTHLAGTEDLKQSVHDLCVAHIDEPGSFRLGSPFLHMSVVQAKESPDSCLVIALSHAQYDGVSLPALLRDLEELYTGKTPAASEPFSTYLAHARSGGAQTTALDYWGKLLDGSSLSVLDKHTAQQHTAQASTARAVFHSLPVSGIAQPPPGITAASLLTAAWALVLARRLQTQDVTFGSITSGRGADALPSADRVMGPCYQFTPVRVRFQPRWTAADLLQAVQQQGAEALAHDFVGFAAIARRCAGWPPAALFDSVVHHQDWEDFDAMPFAAGECEVGILNPHGDAACPLKAVSFVREGEVHVGVVGSEAEAEAGVVDAVLGELRAVVRELATAGEGVLLLASGERKD
ncbi:synthetase-like protein [Trichocladium antarcticum]|uniref:Synthetase-like protein n=1 Tax=Trichocladium antarcticum TaxID=1450529 RepID=A0AAN6UES4_9PEZI|nr:synthetase-like protein [Trichocladium antarcticum]